MKLGWIDFSKTERNKVFSVLDLLGEKGVLDELGISTIRDGFSDLLFPGTSTIQTRAKYFLIVPYALQELAFNDTLDLNKLTNDLDDIEMECSKILQTNFPNENGIIGSDAIMQGSWVKRPPSNIYSAGLRKYDIFRFKSISQYMKLLCSQKREIKNTLILGNNVEEDEDSQDDAKSSFIQFSHFLNIPTYQKDWKDKLDIHLTYEEGQFLKDQIITHCEGSLLAYILENNIDLSEFESIEELESIKHDFPEQIRRNYEIAMDFSQFVFVLRVLYNIIASEGNNTKAIDYYNSFENNLASISNIEISLIMNGVLKIHNDKLRYFLEKSKYLMANKDIDGLKKLIIKREIQLKGETRARLNNIGEFDNTQDFALRKLDYRFDTVQNIVKDIFISEGVI